jgi:PEP-CTERM motif|tara:strand:+ start:439 stop:1062 length:624 start_codon:yes stop_codon:yes gene_type:complete
MRHLKLTIALIVAMCLPAMASAALISANYQVNLNDSDPGLVVDSADYAVNPFSFDLNAGESVTFNLFKIWTTESAVNGDDLAPQPISVDFNFTSPEVMNGSVSGNTSGDTDPDPLFGIEGFFQQGVLTWGAPLQLAFGALGDGLLEVALFDAEFNEGAFWGLGNHGAKIGAKITLISEASEVPEPGTLAMLGLGLLGMGLRARRRSA